MIINNVKLVLEQEVVVGSIEVIDGHIESVSQSLSQLPAAIDGELAYLLPGLVELHTDNLERFFTPRPKVNWPANSAMASHDALMISSGITTVLDAVALGYINDQGGRIENLERMIHTISESQLQGNNRAEHFLHLRCELPNQDTAGLFESFVGKGSVAMVSLMDHTPGQRQFVNSEKYRTYYMGKYGMNEQEMASFEAEQTLASKKWSHRNRLSIAESARARGIPLASHDDATVAHAEESASLGCAIAEFPTTIAAAQASHDAGICVMMGAPNIVRGGSHSGNVAAKDLADIGVLDILSSDYYPASLLDAAYQLAKMPSNDYGLEHTVQMVSARPAKALSMHDRGSIVAGKRADLVLARPAQDRLRVDQVWRQGKRVF
ncbi:alpha-D-ribose 1-methylphosphonate 5-triphosphate diphosphatase [Alginatibacterium sediminis]|uniref:Alpha-D-ribose 1-methylphosphonate 5-triphosphate diphosphatase n=1 Tax=Alginatibacterium sediminis TaxID=2164068 RepID=A0A420EL52_9ALTE|nr:alpha-D-ribose 1-methylphosphonate 5-triphosphate diphosphatase [Alginatibacterium sediminis]RKF21437.1 alpha-D-ribose 1-methylphosphonate 5-triphosphate diphosphatase [Alginatibacterium sediminis]